MNILSKGQQIVFLLDKTSVMNIKSLLLCLSLLLILCSCNTYRHTLSVSQYNTDSYSDDVYAKLDVNKNNTISGQATVVYLLDVININGFNKEYADIHQVGNPKGLLSIMGHKGELLRSMALGAATKYSDYDVVVNPQYRIKRKSILLGLVKVYTVSVSGYGAKVTELKTREHWYHN